MKVLSLFDGISCGRLAFQRAGIQVKAYFASEIDKYAICIAKKNYPETIHIGSVCEITYVGGTIYNAYTDVTYTTDIDMIIGGSPCQNLSRAGDKKGFQGDKSILFWEFVRLLREIKPKYFLFENVASMSKSNLQIVFQEFQKIFPKIYVHMIDSLDFTPQKRRRYYFTNFPFEKPKPNRKKLQDILEDNQIWEKIPEDFLSENPKIQQYSNTLGVYTLPRGFFRGSFNVVCPTVTSSSWQHNNFLIKKENGEIFGRKFTPIECERLQTLPDNYTAGLSNSQRYRVIGNSWTVDVIAHILSFLK
ncbi:MAG: DNA (cytosine-5-)-methyltransferase [Candidatus Altimarinota bacterium]